MKETIFYSRNNKGLDPYQKILLVTGLLLLIPLVAMFFTKEVQWAFLDFLIAGILLTSFFGILYYGNKKNSNSTKRIFYYLVIILVFTLFWIELAVGIFNSPIAGN